MSSSCLMESAVSFDSQERNSDRPLSLSVDSIPSSSPFPSPSSSFLPPPMPGAHEFAVLPPPAKKKSSIPKEESPQKEKTEPTGQPPTPQQPPTPRSIERLTIHTTPDTPTNTTVFSKPSPTSAIRPVTPPPRTSSLYVDHSPQTPSRNSLQSPLTPSRNSTSSLTSSRPAPPSPAPSRRASAASVRSRKSTASMSSRPSSGHGSTLSRHPSKRLSSLLNPMSALDHSPNSVPRTPTKRLSNVIFIKIKDFAYPSTDERHVGLGNEVPKSNRPKRLNKVLGPGPKDGVSDDEDDIERADEDDDAWNDSFKWGFGRVDSWSFAGGNGNGGPTGGGIPGLGEGGPSETDFTRNFIGNEDEDDDEFYDASEEDEQIEGPLLPGLYKALYPFTPEGTAEMGLEEDQIVRVIGRGGGVGWAIVQRPSEEDGEAGVALVPESYLEVVELD